jgi:hypothetical protein
VRIPNALPHGVNISPDGTKMVVSTFSLKINHVLEIQWGQWQTPRQDKILVFDVQSGPCWRRTTRRANGGVACRMESWRTS